MTPEELDEIEAYNSLALAAKLPKDDRPGMVRVRDALARDRDTIAALLTEVRRLTARVEELAIEADERETAAVVARNDVIRQLMRREAELEEAARWRPASERPSVDEPIEMAYAGGRAFGVWSADGQWRTDDFDPGFVDAMRDDHILGWRPLGPGPKP